MTSYLSHSLLAFFFLIGAVPAQSFKPCDSKAAFVDRNMIDYTIRVRTLRGSITDPDGVAVPRDCVALFNSDHSKLLQTVQANEHGDFAMAGVGNGDYWLVVQDPQRAFCPAAARVKVRWYARKSMILAHMEGAGIDRCSYCGTR